MGNFLYALEPIVSRVPTIAKPTRHIGLKEKAIWTSLVLVTFLVASQVPLVGLGSSIKNDPLYWLRMIMASNRGTLMELGIGPAVTSGLLIQILISAGVISYNQKDPKERQLFEAAQKFFAIILTFIEAVAYVFLGMYGPVAQLGLANAWFIVFQLTVAGFMVTLLDDMITKGWGIGSATSIFIATNVAESIISRCFSFNAITTATGKEYEGAVIAFFHLLATRPNKLNALYEAFFRENLPNMSNVIGTVVVFGLICYLQTFHVPVPFQHSRVRGVGDTYKIKLFYTPHTPVMLQSTLVTYIFMISQFLYKKFGNYTLIRMIGTWKEIEGAQGQSVPVGGLAYLIAPPSSLFNALIHPIRFVTYLAFTLASCGFFAKLWIEFSNSTSEDVAEALYSQNLIFRGYNTKPMMKKKLDRYIPIAAVLSGVVVGALTVLADLLGAIGSGTGLLLAVMTLTETVEQVSKENPTLFSK